ncbi:MAG: lamin tail domain-containing protein [Chloroflexia bacterium]|nr:lamin tail domain-containing protein [Chloroflexia bacterium]
MIFTYFIPSSNEVIINELLFNPKPDGVDFIEVYNKATLPVDLSKINLARRSDEGAIESKKQLSEFNKMLSPGVFLAISTDTAKTKLDYPAATYDQFLQIPILPSYNDDVGTVVLLFGDTIIDEFNYNEKCILD